MVETQFVSAMAVEGGDVHGAVAFGEPVVGSVNGVAIAIAAASGGGQGEEEGFEDPPPVTDVSTFLAGGASEVEVAVEATGRISGEATSFQGVAYTINGGEEEVAVCGVHVEFRTRFGDGAIFLGEAEGVAEQWGIVAGEFEFDSDEAAGGVQVESVRGAEDRGAVLFVVILVVAAIATEVVVVQVVHVAAVAATVVVNAAGAVFGVVVGLTGVAPVAD